jgi:hypothetical protein
MTALGEHPFCQLRQHVTLQKVKDTFVPKERANGNAAKRIQNRPFGRVGFKE